MLSCWAWVRRGAAAGPPGHDRRVALLPRRTLAFGVAGAVFDRGARTAASFPAEDGLQDEQQAEQAEAEAGRGAAEAIVRPSEELHRRAAGERPHGGAARVRERRDGGEVAADLEQKRPPRVPAERLQ